MGKIIKGYKGFDQNLNCRGFQYEVGGEYEHEGEVDCCESGFHFCEYPLDVFGYYPPASSRYCEVEGTGKIDRDNGDSKVACSKLKVKAEIGLIELIKSGIKFILDRVDWKNASEFNTGHRSVATNTKHSSATINNGDQSAAINAGCQSTAINTGDKSAAINDGYQSTAINTGYRSAAISNRGQSAAINAGYQSAAINTGDQSAAINNGGHSAAINTGYRSTAINTGFLSAAVNNGGQSAAINIGPYSAAIVEGWESVAMAIGYKSKAKGALGCWLVLAEWDDEGTYIIDVQCRKVDGENIKADTWYQLIGGEFKEVEVKP